MLSFEEWLDIVRILDVRALPADNVLLYYGVTLRTAYESQPNPRAFLQDYRFRCPHGYAFWCYRVFKRQPEESHNHWVQRVEQLMHYPVVRSYWQAASSPATLVEILAEDPPPVQWPQGL